MPTTRRRHLPEERGFALVAVLLVMLLLGAIAGAMHVGVLGETKLRGAAAKSTEGFYAAEAGINTGMGDYRNIFLAYHQPSGSDFNQKTIMVGDRTVRYQLHNACPGTCPIDQIVGAGRPFAGLHSQLYRYIAQSTSELTVGDVETSLGTEFDVNYIPLFQFLAFYRDDLEINPGANMVLHGPVHTNGALYLSPSQTMRIEDLPPSIATVSVTAHGKVYRGRKDSQNTPKCAGTLYIDALADANKDGSLDGKSMPCPSTTAATAMSADALSGWLGAIKTQQPEVAVPEPDVLNRGNGEYWEKADLRLALDLDNPDANGLFPIVVLNTDSSTNGGLTARLLAFMQAKPGRIFYNDVPKVGFDATTTNCNTANTYCNRHSYAAKFKAAEDVYPCADSDANTFGCRTVPVLTMIANEPAAAPITARRGGFYNNREAAWVYMLNVNLHDLLAWNRLQPNGSRLIADPDDATEGGLVIFLTVKGQFSTGGLPAIFRYGVRVFGSPNLDFPPAADPTGVTVVSDQAVYVEGNYNVSVGQPGYNAAWPKQPAAFLGDTVNVLSSNWSGRSDTGWAPANGCRNDCQSRRSLSGPAERPAATTYVNAAFLGGVDKTNPSASKGYNGGLENYPRFHEDWSGVDFNYRGSFVSLGAPRRANGNWCGTGGSLTSGCNSYNPPGRPWDYDSDFQQVANLPPLTPRVVSVEQILFTENFR